MDKRIPGYTPGRAYLNTFLEGSATSDNSLLRARSRVTYQRSSGPDVLPLCPGAEEDFAYLRDTLSIPCMCPNGQPGLLTADPSPANLDRLRARFGHRVPIGLAKRAVILPALAERFSDYLVDRATNSLARDHPDLSARRVITPHQALALLALVGMLGLGSWLAPGMSGLVLGSILALGFVANGVFRAALVWIGAEPAVPDDHTPTGANENLPHYSVLVPLYREANIVPQLVAAIGALDYPHDRIEIVLVVEADDIETRLAIAALRRRRRTARCAANKAARSKLRTFASLRRIHGHLRCRGPP